MTDRRRIQYEIDSNASGFKRGVEQVNRGLGGMIRKVTDATGAQNAFQGMSERVGHKLTDMASQMGRAAVQFGQDAFKIALENRRMEESFNKVFGAAGAMVKGVRIPGATIAEVQKMTMNIGSLAKNMGLGQRGAADLAARIGRLGADIAAFNPQAGTAAEAVHAMGRALAGEFDIIEKFGGSLKESAVQSAVLRAKLDPMNESLSDTQLRAEVLVTLLEEQFVDAAGAAADRVGTLEDDLDGLGVGFQRTKEQVGDMILGFGDWITSAGRGEEQWDDLERALRDGSFAETVLKNRDAIRELSGAFTQAQLDVDSTIQILNMIPSEVSTKYTITTIYEDRNAPVDRAVTNTYLTPGQVNARQNVTSNLLDPDLPPLPSEVERGQLSAEDLAAFDQANGR